MTLATRYQQDVARGFITVDAAQQNVLAELQHCYDALLARHQRSWLSEWFLKNPHLTGIYLWGGVGIGKTYLMDVFFAELPGTRKLRVHYHQFMQQVHNDLTRLQGNANPLRIVARYFSLHYDVLCLDEFMVNDITDAMLLSELLQALFSRGVVIVATSNVAPQDLYRGGLQRQRFLPAIALIEQYCKVVHLASLSDYRLAKLQQSGVFFTPLTPQVTEQLTKYFHSFAHSEEVDQSPLVINDRDITVVARTHDIVWFRFDDLCAVPRCQRDYLVIATLFPTIILSDVPQIPSDQSDRAVFFIHLIDVLYDAKVKLIISAACDIPDIYLEGPQQHAFARTQSRLQEMQSESYLRAAHQSNLEV